MLSLRVARGSLPTVLFRRLAVTTAAAGTGFLLLAALGYALGHPGDPSASSARLAWCAVPFAVALQLSVAVSRAEPTGRLHSGLAAVGLGRNGVPLLAAATTALSCALGSAVALLVYLQLRGTAVEALGPEDPLPFAGALLLLAAVPMLAAAASAACLWPRGGNPSGPSSADAEDPDALSAVTAPAGLPWGAALTAIGLAIKVTADDLRRSTATDLMPLPGGLGSAAPTVLAGWALIAAGMILSGPPVLHACGRLLAAVRPGALRLLAGRALQEEAAGVGRPVGVLCAVTAGGLAALRLYGDGDRRLGPLTGFAAGLIVLCALATVLTAALEARRRREHSTAALVQIGASARLLRGAVAARCAMVLAVALPLTALIAQLAASPLGV